MLLNLLEEAFPDYQDAYWNSHYLFEPHVTAQFLPMLGRDLKREIILNVMLPLLAEKLGSPEEERAFKDFYAAFPAVKAGKAKYLLHRFFGNSSKGQLLDKAYHVQGAYQVHYDYCYHYEASCEGCPFVEDHAKGRAY